MDGNSMASNQSSSSGASNRASIESPQTKQPRLTIEEQTKIEREFGKPKNLRHIPSRGVVIIKWVVTLILCALLLACVTDSKISIVSLSEQMNRNGNNDRFQLFSMLQLLAVIPHVVNFFRGLWSGGFRKDIPWPKPRALIAALFISLMESVGLCLFIFKVPGLFKPASVILMMNCVFLFPTLVNLMIALNVSGRDKFGKRQGGNWKVMFTVALVLELAGIAATFFSVGGSVVDKIWAFSGVTLLSICWIPKVQQYLLQTKDSTEYQRIRFENEIGESYGADQYQNAGHTASNSTGYQTISEEQSDFGRVSIQLTEKPEAPRGTPASADDLDIQFERQPWKLTIFMSFWKALFSFGISMLLFHFFLFDEKPSMSDYRGGWNWSVTTSKQIYYFVANIVTSIAGYMVAYIACTTCMQRWAFSLPLFLATPLAVTLAAGKTCSSLFDPAEGTDTCSTGGSDIWYLIGATTCLVLAQGVSIGWLLFRSQSIVMLKEGQLFWVPMYNPVLLEQWLMLIRRNEHNDEDHEDPVERAKKSRIIICTTMYREADYEMRQLLESIQRVNFAQSECDRHFESHIFFDGAVKDRNPTEFVLQLVSLVESTLDVRAERCTKTVTPYGMSLSWKLNAEHGKSGMIFKIHLKDNSKVKNKKRWSQVMYMSYVLDFLMSQMDNASLEHTYILTTDADVRFTPDSVEALLDLMTRDRSVGAVCARTHPLGSGPMVWYQVFEYAIGHWFQKAAEHVLGSVLCSPGCFSVYRCKALRDIVPMYASNVQHAFDFLTKDMGEDRWLCTLMVQSGWRIEYCAASENSTHCPEEFDEFYKQRRRWVVSTLANLMLLIKEWNIISKLNHRVSFVFLIYQAILLFATLIGPSSVILVVSGGLAYGWNVDAVGAMVFQVFVCLGYVLTCLFTTGKTQLNVAKLLTFVYAIIMTATLVGTAVQVVSDYIDDDSGDLTTTILPPSNGSTPSPPPASSTTSLRLLQNHNGSLEAPPLAWALNMTSPPNFLQQNLKLGESKVISDSFPLSTTTFYLALMASLFILTGFLHLGEVFYLLHGLWYLLFLPSGYLILMVYSICNITDRSWGTREAKTKSVVSGRQSWHQQFMHYFKSFFFCCFEQKPETKSISIQTEAAAVKPRGGSRSTSVSEGPDPVFSGGDSEQTERKSFIQSRYSEAGSMSMVPEVIERDVHDDSDEEEFDENQIVAVKDWLPRDMKQHATKFIDNGFENTMLVAGMTEKELKGIGIKGKGAKRYLMEEIKRLPDYDIQADVPENVETWLASIGLIQYKPNFVREQIRTSKDMEILKSFGRTEIEKELKITKPGHVKRLMYAIRKLRNPTDFERKIMAVKRSLDSTTTHNLKKINMAEHDFWEKLKSLCLSPQATAYGLDDDLHVKLGELRNLWLMFLAVSNFLWLILITTLANKGELLSVVNSNPVGLVVLVMFSLVLVIQFFAMLIHRVTTLTHFLGRAPYKVGDTLNTSWAFNDSDIKKHKQKFGNDDFDDLVARDRAVREARERLRQGYRHRTTRADMQPLLESRDPV